MRDEHDRKLFYINVVTPPEHRHAKETAGNVKKGVNMSECVPELNVVTILRPQKLWNSDERIISWSESVLNRGCVVTPPNHRYAEETAANVEKWEHARMCSWVECGDDTQGA